MNVAPCALLEELTDVPRLFVDLDERIRRQLASVAVATTLRFSLTCCAALGVMALAPTASAQQPSCDEWATATEEFFRNANATTVERCLKAGADVHARTRLVEYGLGGETPLHVAVRWNEDPAVVTILLEAGADVHARNSLGQTPLHDAVGRSIPLTADDTAAVVTLLLEAGADVHARSQTGATPLHDAALNDHFGNAAAASDTIEVLLEAGADVDARNNSGYTPPAHRSQLWKKRNDTCTSGSRSRRRRAK